ncbi:uncharacterized protein LOC116038371 isoform X2 [Sander lucioperca]|uniref:uncharacterized protein LOC116038371 isoform X2 n=1 Tax=Sander lucioperca TaxID=283035 RepID=UPI00125DAE22|nr:uncharacterized protein LOC116038371 isoform X2 [Sander lucioperca]
MADLASEQFLTEREERYLLKLVYRSANETAGGYYVPPKRRIIKMEVCNLRSSDLTRDQIKALAVCLPSLQSLTAEAARRKGRPQQPDSSQLLLVTPVHPEQIDIQALANTQNHFNFMEFEGRKFVRVTSSVHSPDGRQRPKKWRVSDYNLKGQMILSVICTITMDVQISSSEERRHSEQEESRGTT